VTTAYTDLDIRAITEGVYPPQQDTQLLIDVMDAARAVRVRGAASDACRIGRLRLGRRSHCVPMDPFGPVLSSRAKWLEDGPARTVPS
jgi:hypothetical protein